MLMRATLVFYMYVYTKLYVCMSSFFIIYIYIFIYLLYTGTSRDGALFDVVVVTFSAGGCPQARPLLDRFVAASVPTSRGPCLGTK